MCKFEHCQPNLGLFNNNFTLLHIFLALPGGPFNLLTPDLTSYQQQLWLSAQLVTKVATEQETFTKVCSVLLHVKGVSDKNTVTTVGDRVHNRTRTIK